MQGNIDVILDEIKSWLEAAFYEEFSCERDSRDEVATYKSDSYTFEVTGSFVGNSMPWDVKVSARQRLEGTFKSEQIEKGKGYRLLSRRVEGPEVFEYCIEVLP